MLASGISKTGVHGEKHGDEGRVDRKALGVLKEDGVNNAPNLNLHLNLDPLAPTCATTSPARTSDSAYRYDLLDRPCDHVGAATAKRPRRNEDDEIDIKRESESESERLSE